MEEKSSIIIKKADTSGISAAIEKDTTQYTCYKLLDANVASAPDVDEDTGEAGSRGRAAYTVDSENKAEALQEMGIFTVTRDEAQDIWYVALNDEAISAEDIITAIQSYGSLDAVFFDNVVSAERNEAGVLEFTDLDPGYYYIESDLGSRIAVQTISGDVTITEKNYYPGISKSVDAEDESAQIGDEIGFYLTVSLPETANNEVKLIDELGAGLTFNAIDYVKNEDDADVIYEYSEESAEGAGNTAFSITIAPDTVEENKGQTVTVAYTAILNENAVVGTGADDADGNINSVKLNYGSNFSTESIYVDVDTQSFTFDKLDAADYSEGNTTRLPGARFQLLRESSAVDLIELVPGAQYRVAGASESGIINEITTNGNEICINGLDGDVTYYLEELSAPTGYSLLNSLVDIEVSTDNSTNCIIRNNRGSTLPSTGGIGTTIFYLLGALLIIAGILLSIIKRISATSGVSNTSGISDTDDSDYSGK